MYLLPSGLPRPASHSCTGWWAQSSDVIYMCSHSFLPLQNHSEPRGKRDRQIGRHSTFPWEMKMLSLRAHCAYLPRSACVPVGPTSVLGHLNICWQLRGVISPSATFLLSLGWVVQFQVRVSLNPSEACGFFPPASLQAPLGRLRAWEDARAPGAGGEVLAWRQKRTGEGCGVALAAQANARPLL